MERRPVDHTVDGPLDGPVERPTGLLTRFVPDTLRRSAAYQWFLRLTRWLQFVSSTISLGLFSQRLYKVYRLVNSIKTRRGVSGSYGAVEGILAAAVLYTLITTILSCLKRNSSPGSSGLRWLLVLLDLAFMGAFIAVAVLTSPDGGPAGPRHCYSSKRQIFTDDIATGENVNTEDDSCNLPWGTFILAIISTLLHAITAAFHEVRDHRRRARLDAEEKAAVRGVGPEVRR